MKPLAIAGRAKEKGLDVIGICDHNSVRNVAAVCRVCGHEGPAVIRGVEVCSEEEVHMLGLFDREEDMRRMQQLIDENLQNRNNPERFGKQLVCDEHDAVVGRDTRLLIGATTLKVERVVDAIHDLGGLAIASHVDRERFSIISQLGFVPEGLRIDALEVSPLHSIVEARDCFPQIEGYPLLQFSDAHRLGDIGAVSTAFTGASPCLSEFRKALLGEDGREILN